MGKSWVCLRNCKEGGALRWSINGKVVETEAGGVTGMVEDVEAHAKFNGKGLESLAISPVDL